MRRKIDAVRFLRTGFSSTTGTVSYALVQGATLSLISWTGGAQDVGDFLLAQAMATPVGLFLGLRLREQLPTSQRDAPIRPYLRRQARLALIAGLLSSAAWLLAALIGVRRDLVAVGIAIMWANGVQAMCWTIQGQLIRVARFWAASTVDLLLAVISFVSVTVGYVLFDSIRAGAIFTAAGWTCLLGYLVVRHTTGAWRGNPATSLSYDMVMGSSSMASVGQISVGRLGTSVSLGAEALARVGTGSFVVRVAQPVIRGALRVNAAGLGNAKGQGIETYRLLERKTIKVTGIVTAAAIAPAAVSGYFLAPPLLRQVFDPSVVASAATLSILLASAPILFGSMALSQLLVARDDARGALVVSLIALAATAAVVWPLTYWWGEPGAAIAIGVGYVFRLGTIAKRLRS